MGNRSEEELAHARDSPACALLARGAHVGSATSARRRWQLALTMALAVGVGLAPGVGPSKEVLQDHWAGSRHSLTSKGRPTSADLCDMVADERRSLPRRYKMGELEGMNISMLMPPPFSQQHNSYLRSYKLTGRAKVIGTRRVLTAMHKDRSVFPIWLAVSKVQSPDGQDQFMVSMHEGRSRCPLWSPFCEVRRSAGPSRCAWLGWNQCDPHPRRTRASATASNAIYTSGPCVGAFLFPRKTEISSPETPSPARMTLLVWRRG